MAHYKGTAADAQRTLLLSKQRENEAKSFADKQAAIRAENAVKLKDMHDAFSVKNALQEEQFKAATVGLVTATEFKQKRQMIENMNQQQKQQQMQQMETQKKQREALRKAKLSALSFHQDEQEEDEEQEEHKISTTPSASGSAPTDATESASSDSVSVDDVVHKKRKLTKDPTVATHFLPDSNRDSEEAALRARLQQKWLGQQEKMKQELIEITYSYWDGSGHRKKLSIEKGAKIEHFLDKARKDLSEQLYTQPIYISFFNVLSSTHLVCVRGCLCAVAVKSFLRFVLCQLLL